jgi:hypothetical protein
MFDRFVVVDWSANSTPKLGRDSIWIGVCDGFGHRTGEVSVTNLATRSSAEAFLVDLLESDPTSSTLLGVDFSLGYPAGTATALGLTGTAWSAMWALLAEQIHDDDRNANNRFAVAATLNQRLTGGRSAVLGMPALGGLPRPGRHQAHRRRTACAVPSHRGTAACRGSSPVLVVATAGRRSRRQPEPARDRAPARPAEPLR